MHYFNMNWKAYTMPKFVIYSSHAEMVAPLLRAFNLWPILSPDPASMVLVNFYEIECAEMDPCSQYQVEGVYIPHLSTKKEATTLFQYSIEYFKDILTQKLDDYVHLSGVGT